MTTTSRTIVDLCVRSHVNAREKGWVEDGEKQRFLQKNILMHSELAEVLEDYRNHKPVNVIYYEYNHGGVRVTLPDTDPTVMEFRKWRADPNYIPAFPHDNTIDLVAGSLKPCGIPIELADYVIRVAQWAGTAGCETILAEEYVDKQAEPAEDLEELLAEMHLQTALAYRHSKDGHEGYATACYAQALRDVFAFCEENKIDLWGAIEEKEAYNRTRSTRHGGKKC